MFYYRNQPKKKRLRLWHGAIVSAFLLALLGLSALGAGPHKNVLPQPTMVPAAEVLVPLPPATATPEPTPPEVIEDSTPVDFSQPAVGTLTSAFGPRWGRNHSGIDIGGQDGSAICAVLDGTVLWSGWVDGYGNYLVLAHANGYQTGYGHCQALLVQEGDTVLRGQMIAKMGNTGNSTGPHLHFEVKQDGAFQNPLQYVCY